MAKSKVQDMLGTTEVVLIETRQHWMAAIRFAMRPLIVILIGVGLLALNNIFEFNDDQFLSFINDLIQWAVVILFLISIVWLPIDLIRWDSRRYVLTNRRSMRVEGVLRKSSIDSSIEQITDIGLTEPTLGRAFGYADLTLYTASDAANEEYQQLLDGLQYKKAVLDAKEAIRVGSPLTELAPDFIVKGGTNEASLRADGKLVDEEEATPATQDDQPAAPPPPPPPPAAVSPEPEPVAAPEPVAEPALVVEPERAKEPEPEPPAPEPEPAVEAAPEPPAPEPPVAPVVEPEPVAEPAPVDEPEVKDAEPESWPASDAAPADDESKPTT